MKIPGFLTKLNPFSDSRSMSPPETQETAPRLAHDIVSLGGQCGLQAAAWRLAREAMDSQGCPTQAQSDSKPEAPAADPSVLDHENRGLRGRSLIQEMAWNIARPHLGPDCQKGCTD